MMKGLFKKASAAAAAVVLSVSTIATGASAFGSVTECITPDSAEYTGLKWVTRAADPDDWEHAPGMPAVIDDKMIVYVCGTELCALDKETGRPLDKKGTLASAASYGLSAPVYADGKIIVALSGGVIQAFDAETFESLWVYHDELGGQATSTVVYDNGYVYVGFWVSETDEANFVCVPVADTDPDSTDEEQAAAWSYAANGGYYWSGACVTSDLVIFGTDNGDETGDGKGSKIIAADKKKSITSGKAVIKGSAEGLAGDLRSGITKDPDSDYYYVTSKAKKLIRFKTNSAGAISGVEELDLPGASSSTPVIANGRLYIGICGSSAWEEYSGHKIAVIDTNDFDIAYTVETNGYCQSSALISDRDDDNYVYFTANAMPGNVYVLHDKPGMTAPDLTETVKTEKGTIETCPVLFSPEGDLAQYCLSSVLSDSVGTLYFKNDSNNIFAVATKPDSISVRLGVDTYKEGEEFYTDGIDVKALFAKVGKKDLSDLAEINVPTGALKPGVYEIEATYEYGLNPDGTAAEPYKAAAPYYVLAADDYDNYNQTIDLIWDLKDVTAADRANVEKARELYNSLSDTAKNLVYNYDKLLEAEKVLADLPSTDNNKITFRKYDSATTDTVRISWEPVRGAAFYQLFMYDNAAGRERKLADLRANAVRIIGLKPGTEYKFSVKAVKFVGFGKTETFAESGVKTAVTRPGLNRIKGGIPTNNGLLLTYTKSAGADEYRIQYYNRNKNLWETFATVGAEHTAVKIAGLKRGNYYRLRVLPVKNTDNGTVIGYPSNEFSTWGF